MFTNTVLNFTLGNQIGNGGQATVYNALDHQLNATIAIKKIAKADLPNINSYFDESKKLYLTRHHNVVKIMYGCQDQNYIYLAMPHYTKGSLKTIIDNRHLSSRDVIRYALQFLSGLNNIHSKKLLHCDIKLENVLIDKTNKALITDFGLAKHMGLYGFVPIQSTTRELAPPEFFVQGLHNLKFDIYQSGLTLYRMCNGDVIFLRQLNDAFKLRNTVTDQNFINNIARGKFPNRSFYLPHIPRSLRNVIRKTINPNPNLRYNSVLEMLNDLSKIENANDWIYSKNGNVEEWIKPNYRITCSLNNANNSYDILSLKNGRRKNVYCVNCTNQQRAYSFLYDCLNSKW